MNTMDALLVAIETGDSDTIRRCAKAVLRDSFNHLFLVEPEYSLDGDSFAMSTILVAAGEIDSDFRPSGNGAEHNENN